jgi:cell wall-associated NlpC family hydrolase
MRRRVSRAAAACFVALIVAIAAPARASEGAEVVMQALSLVGVPYRYGGEDPQQGLDCSGLVRHVFRASSGLELPRRAEDIGQVGTTVARDELAPGDVVFFNTLGRPHSHVAIYIGAGRFVHAPVSRGEVRVEQLAQRYWSSRFDGARRLVGERAGERAAPLLSVRSARDDLYRGN